MFIKENFFPKRGFSKTEFENRFYKIQKAMIKEKVDAILLTTKVDIHYFSGLVSQFWESPTRPVYLILPAVGDGPIAVIPEIYYESMHLTWVKKIYRWNSPCIEDDGVSLLLENLKYFRNVGMPMGLETQLRMPLSHILFIMNELKKCFNVEFVDVSKMIRDIRLVKSPAEIDKIRTACQITSNAFESLPKIINNLCLRNNLKQISERQILSELHKKLIDNGADKVPFIVGKSDYNGSRTIVDGPTNKIVKSEDIMIVDVGIVYDEYFCDFNRNYAINYSNSYMRAANLDLWCATEKALAIAKPGITFGDLWKAQSDYLIRKGYDPDFFETGRLGHSIGLSLTEMPSVCKNEKTIIKEGVVLTLEPSIPLKDDKLLVHEECIAITKTGYELLTIRASKDFYYIQK